VIGRRSGARPTLAVARRTDVTIAWMSKVPVRALGHALATLAEVSTGRALVTAAGRPVQARQALLVTWPTAALYLHPFIHSFHYSSREAQPRRNVYWSRPSVCLSVTCRIPTLLHGTGCNLGCPLVVHYWADLQSVYELRCYDNILRRTRNVSECLYSFYAWFQAAMSVAYPIFHLGYKFN